MILEEFSTIGSVYCLIEIIDKLSHRVRIVFVHASADVIASTKANTLPLGYGAVFSSQEACESWDTEKIAKEERVESFICLPRPAYRN
ncbi:hypothetical protein N9Y18_01740 [Litoricolaceae bacterium]|nr:hypothetical protein [Litorivicinaceae bacterium]